MKRHIVIYDPWDVVAVPFPFTDVNAQKKRPAVVISLSSYQEKQAHCLLMMVTSAKLSTWPSDVNLIDLSAAGLKSPSIARAKIFSLDDRLILRRIGHLSGIDAQNVATALRTIIAF